MILILIKKRITHLIIKLSNLMCLLGLTSTVNYYYYFYGSLLFPLKTISVQTIMISIFGLTVFNVW